MGKQYSYPKENINILFLENIHKSAAQRLTDEGYHVECLPDSLGPDDLLQKIANVHVLGIRSKTKVNAEHIKAAKKLLTIGCFGIGTNQVDLNTATEHGVPVFNAPFSSTRSVAELAIGYVLMLARGMGRCNNKMHSGFWEKSAKGTYEIKGKTLGVIGYGHIGAQVGLMAEALGMRVVFYDKMKKLPLGNAMPEQDVEAILKKADFITLHVPAMQGNKALITTKELEMMKKTAFIINLSRGTVVDLEALKTAVESGTIAGAALDVYPTEPKSNKEEFRCAVTSVDNVVLTPHIGGSTEEAQLNIGLEVAVSLMKFINEGTTNGAVNFPSLDLSDFPQSHRVLNVHKNEPGVLKDVNKIVADLGANVNAQYLSTYKNIGYLILDIDKNVSDQVKDAIEALPSNIKTRILY
ncbi:MAG: phosphoglycerate dehydrogenase [Deltaproteobacteria bacterium]|nr:phosphoglycerate dehydrogenase [Deltaproteobacteria bacterium]